MRDPNSLLLMQWNKKNIPQLKYTKEKLYRPSLALKRGRLRVDPRLLSKSNVKGDQPYMKPQSIF